MSIGAEYLRATKSRFQEVRRLAERTFDQLGDEQLFWSPGEESNSVAVIIKHLSGNMISRWTDFLSSDGEKNRDRDEEFVPRDESRDSLMARWEQGWAVFFGALDNLQEEDLLRTIYIRQQPHSVIEAVERQMSHYSYHVGQIVYIAKQLKDADWKTLTIPRKK